MNLHGTAPLDNGPLWADTRQEWARHVLAGLSFGDAAAPAIENNRAAASSAISPREWAAPLRRQGPPADSASGAARSSDLARGGGSCTPATVPAGGGPSLSSASGREGGSTPPPGTTRAELADWCNANAYVDAPGQARPELVAERVGEALSRPLGKRSDFASQGGSSERKHRDALRRVSGAVSNDRGVRSCGQMPAFRRLKGSDRSEGPQRLPAVVARLGKDGRAKWGGVYRCAKGWLCPCCAPVITEARRAELVSALHAHRAAGGGVSHVTFTIPHCRQDTLWKLADQLQAAFRSVTAGTVNANGRKNAARLRKVPGFSGRRMLRLKQLSGWVGQVRALEVTHGKNGWHPHLHVLWFGKRLGPHCRELLRQALYEFWAEACAMVNLPAPDERYGVVVRGGDSAGEYVTKWGYAEELTVSHVKQGRSDGSRNPWAILRDASKGGAEEKELWYEWAHAMRGRAALTWSKGLRDRLGMSGETSDEDALAEEDKRGEIVAHVNAERDPQAPTLPSDWEVVTLCRKNLELLELIEGLNAEGRRASPEVVQERVDDFIWRLRAMVGLQRVSA